MQQTACETILLPDTPVAEDSFSGSAHRRLATTLADYIQSESEGRTVALEGQWGTGKSSVIRILGDLLSSRSPSFIGLEMRLFIFDAWSHQGDPLRRSFLEELIGSLPAHWIDKKHWNSRADEIAKRVRKSDTQTTPHLTWFGVLGVLAILLGPVGLAIATIGADFEATTSGTNLRLHWLFFAGLVLALLPFLLVLLLRVLLTTIQWRRIREKQQDARLLDLLRESLAPLDTRTAEKVTTLSFETPEPTSVEFQKAFHDLMAEALCKPERKLAVVLDNLDRVAPRDSLSIWSTLQTFTSTSSSLRPDWTKQLWVIVPYDKTGIESLWRQAIRSGSQDLGMDEGPEEDSAPEASYEANPDVAASFLNKTFQVRLEVPPVALSNWKGYLQEQMAIAFPRHLQHAETHDDFYLVFRLIQATGEATTPRNLKLIVNETGVFHGQWGHAIPLPHMCYYVISRRRGINVVEALLDDPNFPDQGIASLLEGLGSTLRESLAQLAFNVEREWALEFLLGDPIRNAVRERDGNGLASLANLYPEGFWTVMDILQGELTDAEEVGSLAVALRDSELLERNVEQ